VDNKNTFKVYKGQNFRILKAPGFPDIAFGCPPGLIKEVKSKKQTLPSHYVIPLRTFVKGRNHFDFEFIIYTFLFFKEKKEKVTIYCNEDQRKRFKIILSETLFGPTFADLLKAHLRNFSSLYFSEAKSAKLFSSFTEKLGSNKKIFGRFVESMKAHESEAKRTKQIKELIAKEIGKRPRIASMNIPRLENTLTKGYLYCAKLKREFDLFSLTGEENREKFIDDITDFHIFDDDSSVAVSSLKDKRKKIKISQPQASYFEITRKNKKQVIIDMSSLDKPKMTKTIFPTTSPYLGVTFMGVGSGFSEDKNNSCLIAWSEGKGIMVDAFSGIEQLAWNYGISEQDIVYYFLSHVHSDHDAGMVEKVLSGVRIKIISTRIIFEGFLRKMEAIVCFPKDLIESFIDFMEVHPGKEVALPGFERTFLTFDYSLHSIPAGRFRLRYETAKGKKKVISHSGDTNYDEELIEKWYQQGFYTKSRRDDILGFIWDADLIVHDVGGGLLHTDVEALNNLPDETAEKLVLVHQHYVPKADSRYHYANEGDVRELISDHEGVKEKSIEKIKPIPIFKDLNEGQLLKIFKNSEVQHFDTGEAVFSQNDIGNDFYVILEGLAQIVIDNQPFAIYEAGKFFGELAITTENPYRRATVIAKSSLTVLRIPKNYYKTFNLPKIQDGFYRVRNHFCDFLHPSLIASLAFGKVECLSKGDKKNLKNDGKELYIIVSGEAKVNCIGRKKGMALGVGGMIGGTGIISNKMEMQVKATDADVFFVHLKHAQMKRLFKLFPSFYVTVCQRMKKLEEILA